MYTPADLFYSFHTEMEADAKQQQPNVNLSSNSGDWYDEESDEGSDEDDYGKEHKGDTEPLVFSVIHVATFNIPASRDEDPLFRMCWKDYLKSIPKSVRSKVLNAYERMLGHKLVPNKLKDPKKPLKIVLNGSDKRELIDATNSLSELLECLYAKGRYADKSFPSSVFKNKKQLDLECQKLSNKFLCKVVVYRDRKVKDNLKLCVLAEEDNKGEEKLQQIIEDLGLQKKKKVGAKSSGRAAGNAGNQAEAGEDPSSDEEMKRLQEQTKKASWGR